MAMVGGRAEQLMQRNDRSDVFGAVVVLTALLHLGTAAGLTALAAYFDRHAPPPPPNVSTVEIEHTPPPPPPEPPPPPPQAAPEPEPAHAPPPRAARIERAVQPPPPPPPEPTRAAPVMTVAEEFSNDTTETVAVGDNVNATGDTSNNGVVRAHAVTGARIGGTGDGHGTGPLGPAVAEPPSIDYSEHARPECDEDGLHEAFPAAGHQAGITDMTVRVRFTVDAQGRVSGVTALNNPGFGFAEAAMRAIRNGDVCRIRPARDRDGRPVPDIQTFRFHFIAE